MREKGTAKKMTGLSRQALKKGSSEPKAAPK